MGYITDSRVTMATTASSSTLDEEREYGQFSILHVILIAFGAVVFLIGIVVIIVLLKTRKKLCAGDNGAQAGPSRQSPVFIIGHSGRQGRGGDNPAFSRSDEANNVALPSSRNRPAHGTLTRLPTYEEVMSGRVPSAPLSRSQQRSNIRVSQLQRERQSGTPTQPEGTSTTTRPGSETPPPRYAYEYPTCFWEEVPPPPYPSGEFGVVRAMGGPRGSVRVVGERRTEVGTIRNYPSNPDRAPALFGSTLPRDYSPGSSPDLIRAPLAVPTPTVLSPEPSPALGSRNGILTSSGRAITSSVHPPSPLLMVSERAVASSVHPPSPLISTSGRAVSVSVHPPSPLISTSGRAVPVITHPPSTLPSSSIRAVLATAPSPSPHPATEISRPLAASSPAVPRRQPTPAAMPVPSQLEYLLSVGGLTSSQRRAILGSSRSEVQGQGHCHGNGAGAQCSAPMASFDIEL